MRSMWPRPACRWPGHSSSIRSAPATFVLELILSDAFGPHFERATYLAECRSPSRRAGARRSPPRLERRHVALLTVSSATAGCDWPLDVMSSFALIPSVRRRQGELSDRLPAGIPARPVRWACRQLHLNRAFIALSSRGSTCLRRPRVYARARQSHGLVGLLASETEVLGVPASCS